MCNGRNMQRLTTQHHVLLIKSLPEHLQSAFFQSVYDPNVIWQQSYNDFHGGGFAQPKLYAAFSKDINALPFYVPHTKKSRPLLAYKAQPFNDLPYLSMCETFLAALGYSNFNFVTILMYAGHGSHISPHRDREQICGYETAEDVIATFVFGSTRSDCVTSKFC